MEIRVRHAKASDKQPLMEFVSKTWGGHDYLPGIWDEWIRDKSGKMFVVLADGRQVGMNRMRFLPEGVGWLEGARIHPKFRGKGLASLLGKSSMNFGAARGTHIFRLTSGTRNAAAQKQIARMGFGEISRFNIYNLKKTAFRQDSSVRRTGIRRLNAIWRFIKSTPEYELGARLYWESFVARNLNKENLARLIEDGRLFETRDKSGLGAVAIFGRVDEGSEVWNQMGFLCGDYELCGRMVRHLFRSAAAKLVDENYLFLPKGSALATVMKRMGIRRDFQMIVFEGRSR